ncbi:DUF4097 domain-containing protein [Gracilibacillus oryzae]|uniref:DUF4097 domain-containing protein n=1 Tax=Gracilibacillus oryzae TaxID=1672701 RepID=A0A7C8L2F3_9BACI|nr:DUF4097 family beta strand repeat-containing protein [Gracilibacillus oryzae]KAB8129529.1 DUF4097 domain-containing protein [Gracilibacillus oryzae]
MNRLKMIITIAILLIVVGLTGSIFAYRISADTVQTQTEEVNGQNITNIVLDAENEQVELIPTSDSKIIIESEGKGSNSDVEFTVKENEDTLEIQTEDNDFKLFTFNVFNWTNHLKVYVPKKMYQSVQIEIDNGSFHMNDLSIKDVKIRAKNGKIVLTDLITTNTAAEANNGAIKLKNIDNEEIRINTNNGKIEMEEVQGDIIGKTDNGAISLVTGNLDRSIDLQTRNGSIYIQTEKDPTNTTFDTSTHNGRVNLFDNPDWPVVTGDGNHLIKLSTHNGNITVSK